MLDLPDDELSLWRLDSPGQIYPKLSGHVEVDVAVVGAGITGLTTAYLLKKAGHTVAVVEKATVGAGTTGRTTGKVTSQHGLIYNDLEQSHGRETAQRYAAANQAAVGQVASIVADESIDCDWSRQDNYVFTTQPEQVGKFRREAEVAASLGLPASFEKTSPLTFEITAAVKFAGQGRINAQKYLLGLAAAVQGGGSYVFERSNVIGIRDGRGGVPTRIRTGHGRVVARDVIVASNVPTLPLMARGGYCVLEYPTESYIVAAPTRQKLAGMYISPDADHYSILPIEHDGQPMILIGGGGHVSGMRLSKEKRFRRLASYGAVHFGIESVSNKWSDRDYTAYDRLPLVGELYPWSRHVYVATAFQKWGLSNGTAAAIMLRDRLVGADNDWAETFRTDRSSPVKSIPRVAWSKLTGQG